MSETVFTAEIQRINTRMRRAFVISAVAHGVLALLCWRARFDVAVPEALVEVKWLDPVPVAAAAPAAALATAAEVKPVNPSPRPSEVHFARTTSQETWSPNPQDVTVARDRVRDRLASLQRQSAQQPLTVAGMGNAPVASVSSLAGLPTGIQGETGAKPMGLVRGTSGVAPLALSREAPAAGGSAPVLEKLQGAPSPKTDHPLAAATTAREVLAGITLRGPVANRRLIASAKPVYPEWAQRELVEGSVRLYFIVLPDGRVKENILVEKTSGTKDFDDNATRALVRWRFEPISEGVGEQWGSITFEFRLNDARG